MKFAGLAVFLLLGACAVDKTPLTPLGELNVCLRDTALEAKENGDAERFGNTAARRKQPVFVWKKRKLPTRSWLRWLTVTLRLCFQKVPKEQV